MTISDDEQKFLDYWEENRERQAKLSYQLMVGLPFGFLFSLPVIINFFLGKFWYKRADAVGISQFNPVVLILAVFIIAVFVAIISRKFRWERLEQQYREIKRKKAIGNRE